MFERVGRTELDIRTGPRGVDGDGVLRQSGAGPAPASTQNAALAVAPAAAAPPITRLDLTVVTGDMIGHTEFPAFVPSDVTLPANATVVVTITNFDDATALPRALRSTPGLLGRTAGR